MTTNHSRHTTAAADGPGTRYPVRPDGPATPPRRRRAVVAPGAALHRGLGYRGCRRQTPPTTRPAMGSRRGGVDAEADSLAP